MSFGKLALASRIAKCPKKIKLILAIVFFGALVCIGYVNFKIRHPSSIGKEIFTIRGAYKWNGKEYIPMS